MTSRRKKTSRREPKVLPKVLPEELLGAVAQRFRVLGTPSRLRILSALMGGPKSMSELEQSTDIAQSNLSRQITELERAGCVLRSREGREVTVEIADPSLRSLCELVCGSLSENGSSLRST